jgi:hypothetical protein
MSKAPSIIASDNDDASYRSETPPLPPPWAQYQVYLDDQGEFNWNPPRGPELNLALSWYFPTQPDLESRMRKAMELYQSNNAPSPSYNLEANVFSPPQPSSSQPVSARSTPVSGGFAHTAASQRRHRKTRLPRGRACEYHNKRKEKVCRNHAIC